jgi:hypothetical protein
MNIVSIRVAARKEIKQNKRKKNGRKEEKEAV